MMLLVKFEDRIGFILADFAQTIYFLTLGGNGLLQVLRIRRLIRQRQRFDLSFEVFNQTKNGTETGLEMLTDS